MRPHEQGRQSCILDFSRPDLLVALPTLLFALKSRSLAGTVVVSMSLYWLVDMVFG